MALAVNRLIELQGGVVVVQDGGSGRPAATGRGADERSRLPFRRGPPAAAARRRGGSAARWPSRVLQLAFLPLPVIPHLKLTDRGYVAAGPDGLELLPLQAASS